MLVQVLKLVTVSLAENQNYMNTDHLKGPQSSYIQSDARHGHI